ncbi:hypothetical protein [Acinetobacter defluvii]|uniref:hypothetical protein n=1 Tax=Acinetobacter defluvii TaxID=1871111 RepID=UPI003AF966BC
MKITSAIVGIIILIIFLYSSIFAAQYVWDDILLFVNKTALIEAPLSWDLLSSPILPGTSYFRPLVLLSWYVEFHMFGLNPIISHSIGLIIFLFNNILLFILSYLVAQKLNKDNPIYYAVFSTLIYLTHPALIESTAWVSGRFDQFATLFTLISLLIFTRQYKSQGETLSWMSCLLIGISFLLALLSKEVAIWLPIILFIFYLIFEINKPYRVLIKNVFLTQYKLIFTLCGFFIFYFLLRLNSIPQNNIFYMNHIEKNIFELILPLHAIKYYLLQIFLPFSNVSLLQPLSDIDQGVISRIEALFSGITILALFYYAFLKKSVSALLGICAFIYLFLVLYFLPIGIANNIGHSRFLTLPMVFVALAIVFIPYKNILKKIKISSKFIKMIAGVIIIFWFVLSIITVKTIVPFWSNEYTLWYWAYQTNPNSKLARENYINSLIQFKKSDEIIKISQTYMKEHGALEVNEQLMYATALYNSNNAESLGYFEGVISVLPKFHETDTIQSRRQADHFLMSSAQISDCYTMYALALIKYKGDIKQAIKSLKIAEWYLLSDQKEKYNYYMAALLYLNGQYDEARKLYEMQKLKTLKRKGNEYLYTGAIISQYCHSRQNFDVCKHFSQDIAF